MAPRQAPAVVQARGRGAVQGHHRGLRGERGDVFAEACARCCELRNAMC
uniref:Uncharacterized protein n=1 Tax=Arundo donax TaxID=35708 RepID=A0A0A9D0V8_ARUDO